MNLEYYDTRKKKVIDFILGFAGLWIFTSVFSGLIVFVMNFIINYSFSSVISIAAFLIELILTISAIIFFYKTDRIYITIGIISSIIIPLLLAGACFGIFFGLNEFKFY